MERTLVPRCQKPYLPGKESVIPLGHHGRVPEAATENWGASEENFAEYAGSAQDYQAPIRSQGIPEGLAIPHRRSLVVSQWQDTG